MIFRELALDAHLRRALALWAALAVAVCVKVALLGSEHSVYPVFAAGARHWWADMPLYDNYQFTEHIDGFRYSPTFAVAVTPLYLLPSCLGSMAWELLNLVLLVCGLHVLVRDVLPGDWPPQREGVFLTLTLIGSTVSIWSGQSNALTLALILFGLAAVRRERWWTAALMLALAVAVKLWPIAIVLLLMACRPRQLTGRFLAVCGILAFVPFLTRPPEIVAGQYQQWYSALVGPLRDRWPGYRDAWTVWEQLAALLHCQANQLTAHFAFMGVQLLTAAGVLGWCLWQRRRLEIGTAPIGGNAPLPTCGRCPASHELHLSAAPRVGQSQPSGHLLTLLLSMWASWQMLFGPATEQLTYIIIAPSAGWAVMVSLAEKRARWLTVTAWAILALLAAGDIENAVLDVFPAGKVLLPTGVVLFVGWLVWHERGDAYRVNQVGDADRR